MLLPISLWFGILHSTSSEPQRSSIFPEDKVTVNSEPRFDGENFTGYQGTETVETIMRLDNDLDGD